MQIFKLAKIPIFHIEIGFSIKPFHTLRKKVQDKYDVPMVNMYSTACNMKTCSRQVTSI